LRLGIITHVKSAFLKFVLLLPKKGNGTLGTKIKTYYSQMIADGFFR